MSHLVRIALLVLLPILHRAHAQFDFGGGDQVKPALLADTTAIVPGKPFTVVVQLTLKSGWHVYWQFGGDSGAPPNVAWNLPEGFSAAPIQWPLPKAHLDEGGFLTYIYEGQVALPIEITPPAKIDQPEVNLQANLTWLVCEQTCIPGRGEVSLKLPVSAQAEPANADLFAAARAQLPKSEPPPFRATWDVKPDAFTVRLTGLPAEAKVEFFPIPPNPDVRPKRATVSAPAADGTRTATVPIDAGGAADLKWSGLVTAQVGTGPRSGWVVASGSPAPASSASTPAVAAGTKVAGTEWTLFRALWMAVLGGLILNLMPCVLPVIALKIFGFVNQAGEHPERVFKLGLSFVAGVFVFFLLIAGVAISLRAAGHGFFWGMQFGDPRLMLGLIALVIIFVLAMFGVFEITLGGGAENTLGTLARREGYGGAFIHGLFTTLLGTSCTAPLIGPVLGFAVTQSPVMIIAIFMAMAAGMSLPYFLLTWHPAWMRFLPKPGAWMERFKQFMGFVLLAVAVWLLGVFGQARGPSAAAAAGWLMLFLALAGWIFGAGARRWWAILLSLLVIAVGLKLFLPDALAKPAKVTEAGTVNSVGITWEPFSPERVEAARKAGQPVFIDFTAEWCINCKVNESAVLNTAPIAGAFKEKKVLTLKADWTNFDPVISEWLKKFERIGVPLYVLYLPGEDSPTIFPELLTQKLVLDALAKIN